MAFGSATHFNCAFLKSPFSISCCFSAPTTAASDISRVHFQTLDVAKNPLFFPFDCRTSRANEFSQCTNKMRKVCGLFVINWHSAAIDYQTWQCPFQRNLFAVASLALLQQGQRAKTETAQYNIEWEGGTTLKEGKEERGHGHKDRKRGIAKEAIARNLKKEKRMKDWKR